MRKFLFSIIISLLFIAQDALAQPATVSYPFAVGATSCSGGTQQVHFYNYNGTTNVISNASGGLVNSCVPQLRIGTPANGTQRFSSNYASISFNPADHNIYYLWVNPSAPGGTRTYAWKWPIGTCPGTSNSKLDTLNSYKAFILGVAFGADGKAYVIEFTDAPTFKTLIRSIDFTTGVMGKADTLALTGGVKIYSQSSGDVAMSPSGQMFFVMDNKLFTPNYQAYTGTGANLTCTFIDTVKVTGNFVGLTYAEGETVAAFSGGGCPFQEINMLTAANTPITKNTSSVNSASDLATVVSGIGAAKKLVSATPTGTALQYDVVYDVYVRNYGNMDIKNVQVTDDLTAINGAGNVSNISTSFVSNPAGLVLNAGFNGNSDKKLLNGTGTLPNYPVANNNFTIRISCRLSNIQKGIVYNNSAIATAIDFNNNSLRDSSTNGSNPDLNINDKPDDPGEGQPTPLLISIAATTPPCAALTNVLYTQNFGSGTGLTKTLGAPIAGTGVLFPTSGTSYTGVVTQPIPIESYTVTDNANNANTSNFISLKDHTGNANGRMLVVNADALSTTMYQATFYATTCANQQYSLSFYAAFPANSAYQTRCAGFGGIIYPQIKMRIRDAISGLIITEASTGNIMNSGWQQYGLKFVSPASYNQLIIELINDAPGGCGNDVVIDDIQYGTCDALPAITISTVSSGCLGSPAIFSSSLNDPSTLPGAKDFQWQVASSLAGPYTNISGTNSPNYTISSVTAANLGKYYRVIVAAAGNIGSANCQYISPGVLLNAKNPSVAPASATRSANTGCPGLPVDLTVVGGTLGTNASWNWYSGSCGGTLVGTGSSITVTPFVSTTYYVRAEGDCNTTACVSVPVLMTCVVVPVNFVNFTGFQNDEQTIQLNWSVIIPQKIDRFELYRSTDNVNYSLSNTLKTSVQSKELQHFSIVNNISNLNTEVVFYRLYVIGKNGERAISNVIVVNLAKFKSLVSLIPNPASDNTIIKLQVEKESNAVIKVIDNTGRTVIQQQQKVFKGNNFIQINGLDKYSNGVYHIQVLINNNIVNAKLVIIR